MDITRRALFAGMAAVAGAIAARAASIPVLPESPPPAPSLLDTLTAEIQWAHAGLLDAWQASHFSPWLVYSDDEKPNRIRLARALVLSRDLDLSDQLAATINRELESLWTALTRPRASRFPRCEEV